MEEEVAEQRLEGRVMSGQQKEIGGLERRKDKEREEGEKLNLPMKQVTSNIG